MGPYWVQGELIRNDLRETQPGIDLYLDVQLIDVNTCQPVSKAHLDIWSCNATGIYSGVTGDETLVKLGKRRRGEKIRPDGFPKWRTFSVILVGSVRHLGDMSGRSFWQFAELPKFSY